MEEKQIYKKIIMWTCIVTLVACLISFVIFKDWMIVLGLLIGSITRLIGFVMIIFSSNRLLDSSSPNMAAYASYLGRFVIYGIIIYISYMCNVNVIALLIGIFIINIVIFIIQSMVKKEGDKPWKI